MIAALLKPFTRFWESLIAYHRRHLADDPDVLRLKEQQRQAQQSNQRLNVVEQQYLGGKRR